MLTNLPSIPVRQIKKSDTKTNCSFPGPGTESFCVAGTGPWALHRPALRSLSQHPSHTEGSSQARAAPAGTVVNDELAKLGEERLSQGCCNTAVEAPPVQTLVNAVCKAAGQQRWEMGQCTIPCRGWVTLTALWISPFAFIRLSHQSLQNLSWQEKKV